jgi:transposase
MKDPAVRETWAKRVERWKASGLSVKEFAAEVGINARSLSWWRWHLAKGETAPVPIRRRRRRSAAPDAAMAKAATISPMTFVEMIAPVSTDGLEIILPTTVRVCVRPGFDDATLGRLLDVLERRS